MNSVFIILCNLDRNLPQDFDGYMQGMNYLVVAIHLVC